ncbi:MAG: hypothetical protein NVSMB19_00330 [Vulcanimicrobiaceae bacterium]
MRAMPDDDAALLALDVPFVAYDRQRELVRASIAAGHVSRGARRCGRGGLPDVERGFFGRRFVTLLVSHPRTAGGASGATF